MALKEELIELTRKSVEDLTQANVKQIFQVKYGELPLVVGNNSIILTGDPYESGNIYEVIFFEAIDSNGIDIADAISILSQDAGSFLINSPRTGRLRWQTARRTPKFNFWND